MVKKIQANASAFWIAMAFFTVVYLFGGGARSDILSLVLLRPLAAIALALGLARLTREDLYRWRLLFGTLSASALLAAIQLLPLPSGIWQALPGHGILAEVDAAVGLEGLWRPITLSPAGTLNALFSLLVPAAFLALLVKVHPSRLGCVVILAFSLGLLSALIGVAQSAGPGGGPLYFYRVTNSEFAVGLFSNRNHQGLVLACLYPMLAMVASRPDKDAGRAKLRLALVLLVGVALVPLILITGSRLGVGLAALGMLSAPWVYLRPDAIEAVHRDSKKRNYAPLLIGVVLVAVVAITALLAQVSVFSRFAGGDNAVSELRLQVWGPILELVRAFFPFGSGLGSFDRVYRIGEPDSLLRPTYLNHAHNDFLEVALTGGLAGVLIFLASAAIIFNRLLLVVRTDAGGFNPIVRTGASVVVMIALASFVDYPLRTPSIACIFILATVCLWQERTIDR